MMGEIEAWIEKLKAEFVAKHGGPPTKLFISSELYSDLRMSTRAERWVLQDDWSEAFDGLLVHELIDDEDTLWVE